MYLSGVTGHRVSSAHTGQCPAFCPTSVPEATKEEAQLSQDLSTNLTGFLLFKHLGCLWF